MKFYNGETVRSVLVGDVGEPFFQIVKPLSQAEMDLWGLRQPAYWAKRYQKNGALSIIPSFKKESALRHTDNEKGCI